MNNVLEYIKNNSEIADSLLANLDSKEDELNFPTRKDEAWKYFPVKDIVYSELSSLQDSATWTELVEKHKIAGCKLAVFCNGLYQESLSDEVSSLKIIEKEDLNFSEDRFESALDYVSIYTARQGYDLFLEAEEKIQILHIADDKTAFLKNRLTLAEGVEATVLETYVVVGDSLYSTYSELNVAQKSKLNYYSQTTVSEESKLLINQQVSVYSEALMKSLVLDTDPGKIRRRANVDMLEENCEVDFKGFYLVNKKAVVNHKLNINHLVPNCNSKQLYKGILDGLSKVIFDGMVYVGKGAMGTDSEQLNKTTLLADSAELVTRPQLEIYADDVACAHGATLGGFNADEVFYFQSRAISQDKAIQMLAYGFAEDIFQDIEDEAIHEKFSGQFIDRFSEYEVKVNEL